jgi:hypothetical protein
MTDDQLRALVRDAVARHLGLMPSGPAAAPATPAAHAAVTLTMHPSHYRYAALQRGSEGDASGPCLIEPAVICNHCGYCQSHGH